MTGAATAVGLTSVFFASIFLVLMVGGGGVGVSGGVCAFTAVLVTIKQHNTLHNMPSDAFLYQACCVLVIMVILF
jgi:hypothetical protein